MRKLKDEIREKKLQMRVLEQRMIGSVEISPYGSSIVEMSQVRLSTNYQTCDELANLQTKCILNAKTEVPWWFELYNCHCIAISY